MIVLGIDPGSRHTGYAVVEERGDGLHPLDYGRVSCPAKLALPARLHRISSEIRGVIERWHPDTAALETPFHGLNSRSLIVLSQARGALLAAVAAHELEILEYSPSEVKVAVTGNGRADKGQVAMMVCRILSLQAETETTDTTDALAVAVCCVHRYRIDRLTGSHRPR